ncbi:hypothetical protein ACFC0M_39675 [Streptomyces sp. NPDC056149]|uniref:hypothetical protein n=1 Tax=unclassified Streptomyces TaxID=2593676 RepID=UPI0023815883|nr:hypothetical protein [Streptomyces sp. WZ-12]
MRSHIRFTLELAAALAARGRVVEAMQIGITAIDAATRDELPAVRHWLNTHPDAFARQEG